MNHRYLLLSAACILLLTACHKHAELSKTPFQHFQDEGKVVKLTFETDLSALLSEQEDYQYQPLKLTLQKENCASEHFHVETKPRGVFRKAECTFPPLKIRFPDEVLEAGGYQDYPTLKLVTHCEPDPGFDQFILKEYLVFKMYNELTDNSFKAQLVKIKYCDTARKIKDFERFGFLIEHPRELADRMEGRILGKSFGAPKKIHLSAYKVFTVFQYMIGNTDWGLDNRHNTMLVQAKDGDISLPVPVPYDFDFCGFVNAPYAVPHHNHPISDVRERYFQWRGGETDFTEVFSLFANKKEKLLGMVADCPQLQDSVKNDAMAYLHSFFGLLESPEVIVENKLTVAEKN